MSADLEQVAWLVQNYGAAADFEAWDRLRSTLTKEPAPVVAQEPVRGARDALHCAISLAVAAGREDTAEVLRALYAGAAPDASEARLRAIWQAGVDHGSELRGAMLRNEYIEPADIAFRRALEAAAHTKEVGK